MTNRTIHLNALNTDCVHPVHLVHLYCLPILNLKGINSAKYATGHLIDCSFTLSRYIPNDYDSPGSGHSSHFIPIEAISVPMSAHQSHV